MRRHIPAVLVITLGLLVLLTGCSEVRPVEYQIMPGERGNKDLSVPGLKRYTRDITVPYETTDEEIKPTLRQALNDFREVHPDADVLMVRVAFEGATAVLHANVTWAPGGDWYPKTRKDDPKTITFESLGPRPPNPVKAERFGLPLAKRKEIFAVFAGVDDKAWDEAEAQYPYDIDKESELVDKLIPKYKAEARRKYGLTEDQEKNILNEGFEQYWEW